MRIASFPWSVAGVAAAVILLAPTQGKAQAERTGAQRLVMIGFVYDTAGRHLAHADVRVPDRGLTTRSDASGMFRLAIDAPAGVEVWVRHLGFESGHFTWPADALAEIEVAITLRPLVLSLDTVNVSERAVSRMRGSSRVVGTVVDANLRPVAGAEVLLAGSGALTRTNERGEFTLNRIPGRTLQLGVRHVGYAPSRLMLDLEDGEHRDLTVVLSPLATRLKSVDVHARMDRALREFERRELFRGGRTMVFGPVQLRQWGKMPLDELLVYSPLRFPPTPEGYTLSSSSCSRCGGTGEAIVMGPPKLEGDACVLENGEYPRLIPLRAYGADEVEAIEVYAAGSEVTGTVAQRMGSIQECQPLPGVAHPPYVVVWLKKRN